MRAIDSIYPVPWQRRNWTGELVSVDGCPADDFGRDDVVRVIEWATTADDWDGNTAGIVELRDGRFVAWEAEYWPTGDGFSFDAYGGTSDLVFAYTAAAARAQLSERAQELLDAHLEPVAGRM